MSGDGAYLKHKLASNANAGLGGGGVPNKIAICAQELAKDRQQSVILRSFIDISPVPCSFI
jgi:hypothetical protein